jgi:hypothetical protein
MLTFRLFYRVAFVMSIVGTVAFSCTQQPKQVDPINSEFTENQAKAIDHSALAVSFQNPYDSIGQYHNQILDAFISRYDVDEMSAEVCASVIDSFLNQKWGPLTEEQAQQLDDLTVLFESHSAEQIDSINVALMEAEGSSAAFKSYYHEIGDAFLGMQKDVIISELVDIEQRISSDEALSEEEQVILLVSTSVARYSTAYWAAVAGNPSSPWFNYSGEIDFIWYDVGKSDARGGISGGIGGALGGGVPGAVGGAILGAALGSLIDAGSQLLF